LSFGEILFVVELASKYFLNNLIYFLRKGLPNCCWTAPVCKSLNACGI